MIFIFQDHTDPLSGSQKPLGVWAFRDLECCLALVAFMRRRYERVDAMLTTIVERSSMKLLAVMFS